MDLLDRRYDSKDQLVLESKLTVHIFSKGIRIPTHGGKIIEELIGLQATQQDKFSVAHMIMPSGWSEPLKEFKQQLEVLPA